MLAMLIIPAQAESDDETVRIEFEDGFALSVPADWVSYDVSEAFEELGYRYCLGSADGERLMYIQFWDTECTTLYELETVLSAREEIVLRTDGESAADSTFLMYNFADEDLSGGATLLDGVILNLVFSPQSDADNMLIAATILESYEEL